MCSRKNVFIKDSTSKCWKMSFLFITLPWFSNELSLCIIKLKQALSCTIWLSHINTHIQIDRICYNLVRWVVLSRAPIPIHSHLLSFTPIHIHPLPIIFNLSFSPLPPTLTNFQPHLPTHTYFFRLLGIYRLYEVILNRAIAIVLSYLSAFYVFIKAFACNYF